MRRLWLDLAARVARTVLIQNESGSGKEVVSRALHQLTLSAQRPFADISGGAQPPHLMGRGLWGNPPPDARQKVETVSWQKIIRKSGVSGECPRVAG